MDILFLSDNFPPESNAPANRTYEHAREWVRLGHTVTVVTCAPNFPNGIVYEGYKNKWYQTETMEGIKVVRVKTYLSANKKFRRRVIDFLSFMIMGFIAALMQRKPCVVVATSPQFFCGVAGALYGKLKRVPFVLEVRDLWPESIVAVGVLPDRPAIKFLRKIEGWMYRTASLIIIVSEAFRPDISARIKNPEKIRVVVNGVNTQLFNNESDHNLPDDIKRKFENSFVIGYIGTHGRAHGLLTIMHAAKSLQTLKEIQFLLIGEGEKKTEIKNWVSDNKLTNVTLMSHQPRNKIPGLISLCDLGLVPLRNLPLFSKVIPSKIFEYMAMGIPLIITVPAGVATNLIEQAKCGIVEKPEDPDLLANAILRVYRDDELRKQLGNSGEVASQKYKRENQAQSMLSHIHTVVKPTQIRDIKANSNSDSV